MYQDLRTRRHKPVKKAIVTSLIGGISGNSSSPLGAQNKNNGTALQMLLTGVRVRLQRRLVFLLSEPLGSPILLFRLKEELMNKSFDLEGTLILHESLASLSEIRVKLYEKLVAIIRGSEDLSIIGINSRNGSG